MTLKITNNVQENKEFWLVDGRKISNVYELLSALNNINNEVFTHHVNESKNDFYNWINEVYEDRKLADDLLECQSKEAIIFCLKSRLDAVESLELFSQLPKESMMENSGDAVKIFNEIPKNNILEKFVFNQQKKVLVTMLDRSILKDKKERLKVIERKSKQKTITKKPKLSLSKEKKLKINIKNKNEKFNKSLIKKIRVETPEEMLKKIKEAYDFD